MINMNVVIMIIGIVITFLGISMNLKINDINKKLEQEIEDIKKMTSTITILFSVLFGVSLLGLVFSTFKPDIFKKVLQFKIIIGIVIFIEIICIAISSSILTIINDKTFDNETKDDKINISTQIICIIGICLICYSIYSFSKS